MSEQSISIEELKKKIIKANNLIGTNLLEHLESGQYIPNRSVLTFNMMMIASFSSFFDKLDDKELFDILDDGRRLIDVPGVPPATITEIITIYNTMTDEVIDFFQTTARSTI